jgi:heme oxygenase
VRSKYLVRLDNESRAFHGEADSPWLSLMADGTTRFDYIQQLVSVYGFDAPLEAALAYTPNLGGFIDVAPRFRSGLIAQDLIALGLSPAAVAGLSQCMIAPFATVAEAFGWLYVHQRMTLLYPAVRAELLPRLPELASAMSTLGVNDGKSVSRWDDLGQALERAADSEAFEARMLQAAHEAFRTAIEWSRRNEAPQRIARSS